jgi:hypothetical protein
MPTPDDAMILPLEHEGSRATCPPDESRILDPHESSQTNAANANAIADSAADVPISQPTAPPREDAGRAQSPPENHTKPPSTSIEAPNCDTPTPMTSTDDGAEEQRTSQPSPLSANAPAPVLPSPSHLTSPFPTHRVGMTLSHCE